MTLQAASKSVRSRFISILVVAAFAGCLTQDGTLPSIEPSPQPLPAPLTVLHSEGAESETEWYARTSLLGGTDNRPDAGAWHRSTKTARTGNHSWTFQDEAVGHYHDQALYDLHAPEIDLSKAKEPWLRFYYRGESENRSGDEFSWAASAEGGTYDAMGSTDAPAREWTLVEVDLSSYAGGPFNLVFRFDADWCGADTPLAATCGEGSFEGYFVDDVEIIDRAAVLT